MQDTSSAQRFRVSAALEAVIGLGFNLIPLIGVLFWQWSAFAVVFLYWLENVAIGGRTIASMLTLSAGRGDSLRGAILASVFFLFHYGIFCLVHGVFVVTLFGEPGGDANATGMFSLFDVTARLLSEQANLAIGFAAILLWQAVEFVFFLTRRAAEQSVSALMKAPYVRIGILHVTILFGGFVLMLLGWPPIGVIALVLFKIGYDWISARNSKTA